MVQILRSSKALRACHVLTIFTSATWCKFCGAQLQKMLRARGVFYSFDFEIALAPQLQILATSWAADPPQLPFLGTDFASLRSLKTMEKHGISHNSYPPKSLLSRSCAVKHLCSQTSMLQDLPATFSIVGNQIPKLPSTTGHPIPRC